MTLGLVLLFTAGLPWLDLGLGGMGSSPSGSA